MKVNGQSETGTIRSILLKHPREAFLSQKNLESQWQNLNYEACPDYERAIDEYEQFLKLLSGTVDKFHFLPVDEKTGLDSLYLHDPVVITAKGAILCNMGKAERSGEPRSCGEYLKSIGVPVLGEITGEGRLEGGDIVWFDDGTVAVGHGYRTNAEGIRQFSQLVSNLVEEIVTVPLPHWKGPSDVMHLMSILSPIDKDLALVYSPLMPVPFRQWLLNKGMTLVEVPGEEFDSMGCNVLAIAPRNCIMLSNNPGTKERLENENVEVNVYIGEEISKKGAGGPTCLTRPLLRQG